MAPRLPAEPLARRSALAARIAPARRGRAAAWAGIVAALMLAAIPAGAPAQPGRTHATGPVDAPRGAVPGELVVRFSGSAGASERAEARRSAGVTVRRALRVPGAQLVRVEAGRSVAAAARALERSGAVRSAEPNWRFRAAAVTPNDARFGELWGLHNTGQLVNALPATPDADIDAPEAWALARGDAGAVVAVADTGVAYDHPDLAPNMWTNSAEIAGNGLDDDGNGYVDDVRGWDAADGDNDPRDLSGHGTHVAGTLAAAGDNGIGVTGVAWTARVMPVRVLDADGTGTYAAVVEGLHYAGANGARVVNASLAGDAAPGSVSLLTAAITSHPNTLFVVAAGNEGASNDAAPQYPCNISAPNLVCVAATDHHDQLATFSNHGAGSVHLAAPGTRVLSTVPADSEVAATAATDSFETGLAGWTQGGTGGSWQATGTPTVTRPMPAPPHGTHVLDDQPAQALYRSNENYWIRTASPVDLAGRQGCRLEYSIRWDLEDDVDHLYVETSPDGTTWTRRDEFTAYRPTWYRAATFLGSDGQQVHVRFRLRANGGNALGWSFYDGVQVDDVRVRCISSSYSSAHYGILDGTSMATPHVAGAAAVLGGARPAAPASTLRGWLLGSGDARPSLAGKTATGRRLNLHAALLAADFPPVATTGGATGIGPTTATLHGTVNPSGRATSHHFQLRRAGGAWGERRTPAAGTGEGSSEVAVASPVGDLSPDTSYEFRLVAASSAGTTVSSGAGSFRTSGPAAGGADPGGPAAPPEGPGAGAIAAPRPPAARAVLRRPVTCRLTRPGDRRRAPRVTCRMNESSSARATIAVTRQGRVYARGSVARLRKGRAVPMRTVRAPRPGARHRVTVTLVQGGKRTRVSSVARL